MTHRHGFTLVELMVALVVSGVVVLAAHAGLAAMTDGWTGTDRAVTPVLAAASARSALEGWLRSAELLPGASPFRGVDAFRSGQSADEVTFGAGDCGALRPGPCRVRLWIDDDPRTTRRGLAAELAALRAGVAVEPETLVIAPTASGLELRYLVPQTRGLQWVDGWESSEELPRAVQLRLRSRDAIQLGAGRDASSLAPLLRMPLTVSVEGAVW